MIHKNKKGKSEPAVPCSISRAPCFGFTFIEVMIVVTIMIILAVVALVSMDSARSNSALDAATRQVTAAIKLAQSYALQGKKEDGNTVCGFGLRFINNNTYQIYYNEFDSAGGYMDCGDQNKNMSSSEQYNKISLSDSTGTLPSGITVNNASAVDMYFEVPDATVNGAGDIDLYYAGHSGKIITMDSQGVVTVN